MAMAAIVFLSGMSVAVWGYWTNRQVKAQARTISQNSTADDNAAVQEDEPSSQAYGSYAVDPSLPRYVKINKIGVNAMVARLGVNKNGELKAPGNVFNAGWYENSSKPGEGGAVLLDGHVAGPTKHGVFYDIKKLEAGDMISIERGDGQVFNYKVVKSTVADANKLDMSEALLPIVAGKGGLNLITCTGSYSASSGEYNQRIIVFATQVN
jgi:LPXTG-site transpeptidase (sortase) family protein